MDRERVKSELPIFTIDGPTFGDVFRITVMVVGSLLLISLPFVVLFLIVDAIYHS